MNVVPLKDLPHDEPKTLTLDLLKNMDPNDVQNDKMRGQIVLELTYKPFKDEDLPKDLEESDAVQKAPEGTPPGGGVLVVTVHEAQDVEGKHHTNPYVRIICKGEEKKTKVPYKLFSSFISYILLFNCLCLFHLENLTLVPLKFMVTSPRGKPL